MQSKVFCNRWSTLDEKQRAIFFHVLTHHIIKRKKNVRRNLIRSFCDRKTIAIENTRYYSDCPGEGCCKKLSRCEWDEIVKDCTNKLLNSRVSHQPGYGYYSFDMYSLNNLVSYYHWSEYDRCDYMHDCTDFAMREIHCDYSISTPKWLCEKCLNMFAFEYHEPPCHFSRIDNIELVLNISENRCIFGGY